MTIKNATRTPAPKSRATRSRRKNLAINLEKALARPFEQLDDPSDEHRIDKLISHLPGVAATRDRIMRLAARIRLQLKDHKALIAHEDAWVSRAAANERLYYGAGHAAGVLIGRIEAAFAVVPKGGFGPDLVPELQSALRKSALPREIAVAVLSRHAKDLLDGLSAISAARRWR